MAPGDLHTMDQLARAIWGTFGAAIGELLFVGVLVAFGGYIVVAVAMGMFFKFTSEIKSGDKVLIDGEEGMVCSMGLFQTKITILNGRLRWRYIRNSQLNRIRMEKIIYSEEEMSSALKRWKKDNAE